MLEINLRNSKTREIERLRPVIPGRVGLYLCGPTVYDRAHLGNARNVIVFDILVRLLRHVFGADHVTYVRNITDVDDKINARAAARNLPIDQITAQTIAWYHEDMAALGNQPPDREPRATQHIQEMIDMIQGLIEGGHAYEGEGHVLFRVRSDPQYGGLSGRAVDDMIAGARVEVAPYKEDPMDFVLWKPSKEDVPGWPSPWGRGRPGWHIECSAMSAKHLGQGFDIHGGGVDLMFPHHENECAQSRCVGHDSATIWLHNEMLLVEGKKMSKSLGNFFSVRDLLDQDIPGEVIRLVFLQSHYSKPMDWTDTKRDSAHALLTKWYGLIDGVSIGPAPGLVLQALADDLNTPLALSVLHRLAQQGDLAGLAGGLSILGLLGSQIPAWAKPPEINFEPLIAQLTELRARAVETRDFAKIDAAKAQINAAGIDIKMSKDKIELSAGHKFDNLAFSVLLDKI